MPSDAYFHLQTPDWQDLANCRDAEGVMDSTDDRFEMPPGDKSGCANGHSAPFGVRCSVCNTDKRELNGNKWDVFYVEVRHVVRVEVLAGVYNNPSEANADPDFQEYLTSPMELCDINGWSVITEGRQIERLDSYGPGPWTLTAVHHSRQHRADGVS